MTAIVLLVVGYNFLLINGGKGPFTLYASYWTCHCSDTEDLALSTDDILEPEIITVSGLGQRESIDDDICHAEREPEFNKICKTKLPLRYINLLLSNSFVIGVASFCILDSLYFSFSNVLPQYDIAPRNGIASDLIRPPKNLLV